MTLAGLRKQSQLRLKRDGDAVLSRLAALLEALL